MMFVKYFNSNNLKNNSICVYTFDLSIYLSRSFMYLSFLFVQSEIVKSLISLKSFFVEELLNCLEMIENHIIEHTYRLCVIN